jgi:hypothetical protein
LTASKVLTTRGLPASNGHIAGTGGRTNTRFLPTDAELEIIGMLKAETEWGLHNDAFSKHACS